MKSSLLFPILVACLLSASAVGQEVSPAGFKGRVRALSEYNYRPMDLNEYGANTAYRVLTQFDQHGKKLRQFNFNRDGSLRSKSVFKYDKHGNLIEERNFDAGGKYQYAIKFARDRKGRETERKEYGANGLVSQKANLYYDHDDNLEKEETFDLDNHLVGRALWKYDGEGRPVEEAVFDMLELETRRTAFIYDSVGNLIEQRDKYYDIVLKVEYGYDPYGNVTEEKHYNAEGILDKRIEYKYDDKGNYVLENLYSAEGRLRKSFTYTNIYDKMGNLVQKIQNDGNHDRIVEKRELLYY